MYKGDVFIGARSPITLSDTIENVMTSKKRCTVSVSFYAIYLCFIAICTACSHNRLSLVYDFVMEQQFEFLVFFSKLSVVNLIQVFSLS